VNKTKEAINIIEMRTIKPLCVFSTSVCIQSGTAFVC